MAINVGNLIVKNKLVATAENAVAAPVTVENKIVQMEEGTVVHNGKPKKFNKKMSAYMIDMLTSEE
jgi:hypothetical protein